MPEFLKGNYKSPKIATQDSLPAKTDSKSGEEFEEKALERLGGSIAFVMKSKQFLWTPGQGKKPENKK